jgi:hypothetical protein
MPLLKRYTLITYVILGVGILATILTFRGWISDQIDALQGQPPCKTITIEIERPGGIESKSQEHQNGDSGSKETQNRSLKKSPGTTQRSAPGSSGSATGSPTETGTGSSSPSTGSPSGDGAPAPPGSGSPGNGDDGGSPNPTSPQGILDQAGVCEVTPAVCNALPNSGVNIDGVGGANVP